MIKETTSLLNSDLFSSFYLNQPYVVDNLKWKLIPIDIQGWIEFSLYLKKEERDEKHTWLTWMDISSLVDTSSVFIN